MDPRIERTRSAVRRAALVVLAREGWAAFTVEGVAAESGVAKSTIYRHWPSAVALVIDALESLNVQPRSDPEDGPAREEVVLLARHLVTGFSDPLLGACIPSLVAAAEHHPEVARVLHTYAAQRRTRLVEVIRGGVADGRIAADVDPELAAVAVVGAVLYRRTMTARPMSEDEATRLVALVLGPPPGRR